MIVSSVSPGTYSITMKKTLSCFSAVMTVTMLGWLSDASRRGSRSSSPKSRFCRWGTLRATRLSIQVSSARYTVPNPPLPSGSRMRYLPSDCPRNTMRQRSIYSPSMSPRFFAPLVEPAAQSARLPADEAHHLTKVLRLGAGAAVHVFDGRGHEWSATVETAGRAGVVVRLGAALTPVPEPSVHVTVGVGLQKGDGMETVIREATALGASAIVPLWTGHVAVPARARDSRAAVLRWQRVAVASVKQCGRATVPEVRPIATLDAVLAPPVAERILMCVEPRRAGSPGRTGTATRDRARPRRARGRMDGRGDCAGGGRRRAAGPPRPAHAARRFGADRSTERDVDDLGVDLRQYGKRQTGIGNRSESSIVESSRS